MGAWKIVFTDSSIADLRAIVTRIASDNPSAAERFGKELIDRVSVLETFPDLGSPYRKRAGLRKLHLSPYQIVYKVNKPARCIEIVRYWHSSRQDLRS